MIKALKTFGLFWYDFVVGDDWTIALAAVAAVALTAFAAHHGINAWCTMAAAAAGGLTVSDPRAAPPRGPPAAPTTPTRRARASAHAGPTCSRRSASRPTACSRTRTSSPAVCASAS